jgi:hypothetical protein
MRQKGSGELGDLSKKEKITILKTLWNEKNLREFFHLGTQNREWLEVLNSLKGSLPYAFPKFKLLDSFTTSVGDLIPYYWGNHRDSFHRYIEKFLNIKEDHHMLYFDLIGKKTPLYEYIFECIIKLYQDEYDSTVNYYQHPKCNLEVELKEISENAIHLITMISAGRWPDLTNSLEDRRTIWKLLNKELKIKTNKSYTLPELLHAIFEKLVISIDILPKSIKRNSSPQSPQSPIGEQEAMAYLYREFFLD